MEVRITKAMWEPHKDELRKEPYSIGKDDDKRRFRRHDFSYQDHVYLDLSRLTKKEVEKLLAMFETTLNIRGTKTIVRDIKVWLSISSGEAVKVKARSLKQMCKLLIEHIRTSPRRWIYKRIQEGDEGVQVAYYVDSVNYRDPHRDGSPPYVEVNLLYEEFGIRQSSSFSFYGSDCIGKSPAQILASKNYCLETDMLRDDYETFAEICLDIKDNIGEQYLGTGVADDEGIDGNDDGDRWYRRSNALLKLDPGGVPTRVVIDVFQESPRDDHRRSRASINTYFWKKHANKTAGHKEFDEEDEVLEMDDDEDFDTLSTIEIPLHPYVATFSLKTHKRLRVHVANLTKYEYDETIREKLVLPEINASLIDTLMAKEKVVFEDVIAGKTGGVIILCQGVPGTGKTLTAEIYAEHLRRPLYTVQCSQLGIDAETLEENLLKSLARSKRWNAVMLLDEADVYVTQRGTDLEQNAIVGVFLRVLEYHDGVLFLTTNRGDLVDDAILSRATARIQYTVPTVEEQKQIWQIMATQNRVLMNGEIDEIVAAHPDLSGRDIKNLLKLCLAVSKDTGKPITAEMVGRMKRFKPTAGELEKYHAEKMGHE